MQPVKILSDSTCDLSSDLLKAFDIHTVPLYVTLGEKSLKDGITITPHQIYEHYEATKKTPKTAASTLADFYQFFEPYADAGQDIVYIGISEEMSSTVQNARVAAREFPNVTIRCVDSRSLSTGIGLLVLKACDMAREGASADTIADALEATAPRVSASFVVDDVSFLYHGGRCSAVQAFGASLFSLKPQIVVKDGKMSPAEKFRGSIQRVAKLYAEQALRDVHRIDPTRVFITYSPETDAAVVQAVREAVESKRYFKNIYQTEAGCVITSHCGRNTIGVLYVEKG